MCRTTFVRESREDGAVVERAKCSGWCWHAGQDWVYGSGYGYGPWKQSTVVVQPRRSTA